MADHDAVPASPSVLKSALGLSRKKASSSTALSVGSDGSGNSGSSSKHSLHYAHTYSPDDSGKKHRDVMTGLFSRKKKGKKGADNHDMDGPYGSAGAHDRNRSREAAGSEGSFGTYDEVDEGQRNTHQGPNQGHNQLSSSGRSTPVKGSLEDLPGSSGSIRKRSTSPALSINQRRGQGITLSSVPTGGSNGQTSNLEALKSPIGPSRKGTIGNPDLKVAPGSAGLAVPPATTVTPPTPTDQPSTPVNLNSTTSSKTVPSTPPAAGRKGRSGSLSNTPSKLSQSMTHPLTPMLEAKESPTSPRLGQEDEPTAISVNNKGPDGSNEKGDKSQGGNSQSGFFQTMFSAAQNAATTLSNTVANNITKGESRNGSGANTPDTQTRSGTETEEKLKFTITASGQEDSQTEQQPKKRPAVETLGYGELSLGSLGILSNASNTDLESTKDAHNDQQCSYADADGGLGSVVQGGGVHSDDVFRSSGGIQAGRISLDKGTSDPNASQYQLVPMHVVLPPKTPLAEDATFNMPPTGELKSPGYNNSTPNGKDDQEEWIPAYNDSLKRSGSSRSNRGAGILSGHVRRHRGSSSAASSMHNNIQSSNLVSPASPAGSALGPKITGFAVASKKRNREFHSLFRSVPEDDYLIEDYSCALQKDILLHGRLYISEGHICFNSNILGWINTLVISFDEVMAIEKKNTAMVFPNAIIIQTLHAKNVFASLISRDTTYDLLVNIWKISHPGLIPSVSGFTLEKQPDKGNAQIVKDGYSNSESDEEYDEDEEGYEDDEGGDDEGESAVDDRIDGGYGEMHASGGASNNTAVNASGSEKGNRTNLAMTGADGAVAANAATGTADDLKGQDFPGPAIHGPTGCGDHDLHYERVVCEEYLPGALGQVYSLLFGKDSHGFLTRFLLEDQKVLELNFPNNGEWAASPEAGGKKIRAYSYIRPLSGSIGPKQTKCICTEQLEQFDLERCVSVLITTQTPDVPSGSQFCVKTRYCLTWGDGSMTGALAETKMVLNCAIEWSGKSWLKGPIEKGVNDGQISNGKDLTVALKRELEKVAAASLPRGAKGGKAGGKKAKGDKAGGQTAPNAAQAAAAARAAKEKEAAEAMEREKAAWGVFLPLKPVLKPLMDVVPGGILGLLFVVGVVFTILCVLTGRFTSFRKAPPTQHFPSGRYGYWEHSWYKEEQGLWDWLEDRVGLNDAGAAGVPSMTQGQRRMKSWKKLSKTERKQMEGIIGKGRGRGREVEEAVRVMERKLEVLKEIVEESQKKAKKRLAQVDDAGETVE